MIEGAKFSSAARLSSNSIASEDTAETLSTLKTELNLALPLADFKTAPSTSQELQTAGNSMQWCAVSIRQMRYRLGWSKADFARRLGCQVQHVTDLERGDGEPSKQLVNALTQMSYQVESYCGHVQRYPLAEMLMQSLGLEQIHADEIRKQSDVQIDL